MKISACKILDFDIETRPLSFMGGGFTTDEITSIATSFVGDREVNFFYLPAGMETELEYERASVKMLSAFVEMYNQADIVTGHYVRGFDLGKINGALVENNMPVLGAKMVCDTKTDLVKFSGISKSQENLGLMLAKFNSKEYLGRKEHVSQTEWRIVNRLTKSGISDNKRRVTGDVKQHKELREALLKAGLLRGPRAWRP